MKILVVNTLYYPNFQGGAEKSVQLLCEGFVDKGNEVVVVSNSLKNDVVNINGVTVHYLRTRNVRSFLKVKGAPVFLRLLWHLIDIFNPFYFFYFKRLIKNFKPDVLFTNNLSGFSVFVWVVASFKKMPIVHTLRDHALMCPRGSMFNKNRRCDKQCFKCRVFSFPKKKMSSLVSGVVGISEYILSRHKGIGYFSNVKYSITIPNSVADLPNYTKGEIKNKQGLVFGYFGRLCREKGVEYLVDDFLNLDDVDTGKLLLGGTGEDEFVAGLKQKCVGKNIEFLGYVSPVDFYSKIDYLLVPSLMQEPFGRVVIEAWQYGVFVIAAESGGMTELQKYGNLELFNPEKGALAEKIQLALKGGFTFDQDKYLNNKSLFNKNIVSQTYLDLFKSLKK